MYSNRYIRKQQKQILPLLLRRYEFVLGSSFVHDHAKKYDDAPEDAFYQVEEFVASVYYSFGIT